MWANPQNQKPIEKIRKAQWSTENTAKTQEAVDALHKIDVAVDEIFGHQQQFALNVQAKLRFAMERFRQLDGGVVLPERKP